MAEPGLKGELGKKMGPLPVWAWGLILGVGVFFIYRRMSAGSSSSGSATSAGGGTASVLDPNAVDPNTGLTYGAEESAAENASASAASIPTGGGGSGADSVPTVSSLNGQTDLSTELGDLGTIFGLIQQVDPNFQGAAGTAAANAPVPVQGASPPTVNPSAHTSAMSPYESLTAGKSVKFGQGGGDVLNFLKSQGYKNTGKGITGTYTKKGAPTAFAVTGGGKTPFSVQEVKPKTAKPVKRKGP